MKKLFTLFAVLFTAAALNAQNVDYALLGFISSPEDTAYLTSLNIAPTDDFNVLFDLQNNGPDVPAETDTIKFHLEFNGGNLGFIYVLGTQTANLVAGQITVVGKPTGSIISASDFALVEQEIGQPITEFEFCATVEIVGAATDPVPANNTICLMVARGAEAPTSISEIGGNMVSIYPNPATSVINIDNAEGAQIALFDINGKMVYSVEHAAANQQISTEGLTQGLYIARIISGNDVVTKKINVVR